MCFAYCIHLVEVPYCNTLLKVYLSRLTGFYFVQSTDVYECHERRYISVFRWQWPDIHLLVIDASDTLLIMPKNHLFLFLNSWMIYTFYMSLILWILKSLNQCYPVCGVCERAVFVFSLYHSVKCIVFVFLWGFIYCVQLFPFQLLNLNICHILLLLLPLRILNIKVHKQVAWFPL